MAQLIPVYLTTSSDFSQELELGNQLINMRIKWNVRNGAPHMDFTDDLGVTLYGIKIVPYWPLLRQIKGPTNFKGDLMVLKEDENASTEITYANLGNGQNFYYLTEDEVETWEINNGSL